MHLCQNNFNDLSFESDSNGHCSDYVSLTSSQGIGRNSNDVMLHFY